MSKVITFSRFFPAYHPHKGEPTYFVEKVVKSFHMQGVRPWDIDESLVYHEMFWFDEIYNIVDPKHHTIRSGHRWKEGDWFSPRVWSGKPYRSKMIQFAPDIQIKKVWNIGLRLRGDFKEFYCDDTDLTGTSISTLAKNDGLTTEDLFSWFNKPFTGQIICWSDQINY